MVPLGPMAFMPGELVHTNELMVLLGDNYFVERSAAQAAEIMQRRIDVIEDIIQRTEKKIKDLEARDSFSHDARQVPIFIERVRERKQERALQTLVFRRDGMGHSVSMTLTFSFCCRRRWPFLPPTFHRLTCKLHLQLNCSLNQIDTSCAHKALLAKLSADADIPAATLASRQVEERAEEDDDEEGLVNFWGVNSRPVEGSRRDRGGQAAGGVVPVIWRAMVRDATCGWRVADAAPLA